MALVTSKETKTALVHCKGNKINVTLGKHQGSKTVTVNRILDSVGVKLNSENIVRVYNSSKKLLLESAGFMLAKPLLKFLML